jgi:trehalose 6-phosphate synthase/phosphatase
VFSREIIDAFLSSGHKKSLFLDYDGTLREFERNPEDAVPSEHLKSIFRELSERPDFNVVIVSGRGADFLDKHFGEYNFTLVAEHGYLVRKPGREWTELNPEADLSWKKEVESIFRLYALSTPGSAVEVKRSAIVWHYRKADPEFGIWKANHLLGELTESISNLPVEIHHGKRIVEVGSQQISKGFAVEKLLKEIGAEGFAVCIGDDQTDETMLQLKKDKLFTIKVGGGTTAAAYRIPAPKQVREFLKELLNSHRNVSKE